MNKAEMPKIENTISFKDRHRFSLMILSSLVITMVLVVISMYVYDNSGAAQVDLSRPGYISVRSQAVTNNADFQNYSSTGEVNQETISEFQSLFVNQVNKAKSFDAFGGDPLSPNSLGIGAVAE